MTPFEFLYCLAYSFDKRRKLKGQKRLPHPVISIGNITVGGTGKTPATIAIAEEAKKRGFYPIILTRGYKGKAKGPCFVSPRSITSTLLYGDEPVLMAERLPDVPIVKCADRYEGGMFAIENFKSQISNFKSPVVFILDDGFQHYKLFRDKDIVIIDGMNPFGNGRLLPYGPLREPLSELKRAGIFVITKAKNKQLAGELKKINPSAPICFSEYKTRKLRNASGNEFPFEMLKDKKVFAFSGIANPESFRITVENLCESLVRFKGYRDHHTYTKKDMAYIQEQKLLSDADHIITTEKDMVKIRELNPNDNIFCLEISFDIDKEFFECIFADLYR